MTAEEIDVFELAEKIMGSQSIEASVWLIKEYADQEARKAFNAAREGVGDNYDYGDLYEGDYINKFKDYDNYKKQNHE